MDPDPGGSGTRVVSGRPGPPAPGSPGSCWPVPHLYCPTRSVLQQTSKQTNKHANKQANKWTELSKLPNASCSPRGSTTNWLLCLASPSADSSGGRPPPNRAPPRPEPALSGEKPLRPRQRAEAKEASQQRVPVRCLLVPCLGPPTTRRVSTAPPTRIRHQK